MLHQATRPARFGVFDWFVIAGGLVNAAVVGVLVVYWLAQ